MNLEKVIDELSRKYPGKKIIKNKEEEPTEIICEIEPGFAVAVVDKSEPHFHKKTTETYEVIKGELTVFRNGRAYKLKGDDKLIIEPGEIHYAVGDETWVKVYSEPGWDPEDHILADMRKGVNIIITDDQNRILALKRKPDVEFSPNLWDLPGGKVENDESLQKAVKREAKEESGLDVEPEERHFFIYHYPNGKIDVYAFRAKLIGGTVQIDEKHTEFKWISKDDWKNLDCTPSVTATLKEFFK